MTRPDPRPPKTLALLQRGRALAKACLAPEAVWQQAHREPLASPGWQADVQRRAFAALEAAGLDWGAWADGRGDAVALFERAIAAERGTVRP